MNREYTLKFRIRICGRKPEYLEAGRVVAVEKPWSPKRTLISVKSSSGSGWGFCVVKDSSLRRNGIPTGKENRGANKLASYNPGMNRTIQVINQNILVELLPREEQTPGGIVLPERSQRANIWGVVRAVSDGCVMGIRKGDNVLVPRTAGTHYIPEGGNECVIVDEVRVLAFER